LEITASEWPFLSLDKWDVTPSDFATIGLLVLLEALLSADNAMVLAILVLGLPRTEQRKALRYGIVGAFTFRIAATLLAVYLKNIQFVLLIGAAYLLWLPYNHFTADPQGVDRRGARRRARGSQSAASAARARRTSGSSAPAPPPRRAGSSSPGSARSGG